MSEVKFYPRKHYAEKGLAPERIAIDSVRALARAARIARDKGVLSDAVIDLMLPNLMIEGRSGDFGVNRVELPRKSQVPSSLDIAHLFAQTGKYHKESFPVGSMETKASELTSSQLEGNAKLAVAALSQKESTAKKQGKKTGADVIQLWNGTGPESVRHRERVLEADKMLKTDPMNADIKKLWDDILGVLPSAPIEADGAAATSALLTSMISEYDSNK